MTKTPNISSASLCSSSWKTRLSSSKFQRSNHSQTNINEKHHASKKSFKSQIGISSKKSIQCKGCKSTFRIYSDISSFMYRHVLSNDKCPKAYPKCLPPCNKIFYNEKTLHLINREVQKILHVIKFICNHLLINITCQVK